MSQLEDAAYRLLKSIYTTKDLKVVSATLEALVTRDELKQAAHEVVMDDTLSDGQKISQLQKLFSGVSQEHIHTWLDMMFEEKQFWLFDSKKFDMFDEFVKVFQLKSDELVIVHMGTAIPLYDEQIREFGHYFSEQLDGLSVINLQVNPEIMGGALVRINNLIFDYSLRAKFKRFEIKWIDSLSQTQEMLSY